jgi:hypothetical protein
MPDVLLERTKRSALMPVAQQTASKALPTLNCGAAVSTALMLAHHASRYGTVQEDPIKRRG